MNIKELLNYGKRILTENSVEDANIIARVLAQYILKLNAVQIIAQENKTVEQENKDRYYLALIEIIEGLPLQYITNEQEFMKMKFYVDENVLIPQPDTEILVEEVIKIAKGYKECIDIIDIGTGSGAIAIALAKNLENVNITMSDISKKALKIAKKNWESNIGNKKVEIIDSDLFENITKKYNIIVSNPPYIETHEIENLPLNVKNEPHLALDGGKEGIYFYEKLIKNANKYLKKEGYLCLEIGYNQKEKVEELIKKSGLYNEVYNKKDLSGNDRVIICKIK